MSAQRQDAVRRLAAADDRAGLRRALPVLAELVAGHVASVDRVTAQFLGGTLDQTAVAALRLPVGA